MRIYALTTGVVELKRAFLFARQNWRRQLDLLLPGPWCEPVPIHCWAIEHEGRLILVDTGETAEVRDIPFARFTVGSDAELPGELARVGLSLADVDTVVLTHLHGDHMDGAVHVRGPVLVHDAELAFARSPMGRIGQRISHQPVPAGVDLRPLSMGSEPFGAFAQSSRLSDDGRIVAVPTPGHTPGHISIVCIDDEGRHVLIAGAATDTVEHCARCGSTRWRPSRRCRWRRCGRSSPMPSSTQPCTCPRTTPSR